MALRVGLIADCPGDRDRAEERAEEGDPGAAAGGGASGGEEDEDEGGVEGEEGAVEGGDLAADGVDSGLLEGDTAEDEVLLLDPLLEEKLVGGALGDLVERMVVLELSHGGAGLRLRRIEEKRREAWKWRRDREMEVNSFSYNGRVLDFKIVLFVFQRLDFGSRYLNIYTYVNARESGDLNLCYFCIDHPGKPCIELWCIYKAICEKLI